MVQCCRGSQWGVVTVLAIAGFTAWGVNRPASGKAQEATTKSQEAAKPAEEGKQDTKPVETKTTENKAASKTITKAVKAVPAVRFAIPLISRAAGATEKKAADSDSNRKHPLEGAAGADLASTTIEFDNTSSEQLAVFRLLPNGQRQAYGTLPPSLTAEYPATTGEKWLIADTKKNAIAIFIADGQPRSIKIDDDQIRTWKQQLDQEQIIVRGDHGETLQTFCIGPDDSIYALLAAPMIYGETPAVKNSDATANGEVRVYSPKGEELRRFPLDFKPHRIAVAPDGEVIVGGPGVIARYKSEGTLIAKDVPPNMTGSEEDWKKAAEKAREENIAQYKDQVANLEQAIKAMKEKKEGGEEDQPSNVEAYTQIIKNYQDQLKTFESQSIDDAVKQLKATQGQVYALTASKDAIYAATRMTTGYGFAVWKMGRDAKDGKQIIDGLSGCCGQLDIQVNGEDFYVAENSRHRVLKFDADGKKVAQFGSRARGGDGDGFGGCCNPMNLCFAANGDIFTAESEGKVKCFSPDGKFVSTLAAVRVSGGCKNVAVATTKSRDRVFFLDLNGSKIVISKLNAKEEASTPAPKTDKVETAAATSGE
jgi:hypothetical protein